MSNLQPKIAVAYL